MSGMRSARHWLGPSLFWAMDNVLGASVVVSRYLDNFCAPVIVYSKLECKNGVERRHQTPYCCASNRPKMLTGLQMIADAFRDYILANPFSVFHCPHGPFPCRQPKPTQTWWFGEYLHEKWNAFKTQNHVTCQVVLRLPDGLLIRTIWDGAAINCLIKGTLYLQKIFCRVLDKHSVYRCPSRVNFNSR